MQQPPNYPNWQQPQQLNTQYLPQPLLPNTYYPSQPRQQPPMMPPPSMQSPKRPDHSKLKAWLIIGAIVLAMGLSGGVLNALSLGASNTSSQAQPTDTPTPADTFSQIQNQVNQIAQSRATFSQHLDSNYFTYEQTIVITELIDDFAHNNAGKTEARAIVLTFKRLSGKQAACTYQRLKSTSRLTMLISTAIHSSTW